MKAVSPSLTLEQLRVLGFEILCKELGPAAAIRFVRQYELGSGDYTRERRSLLRNVTLEQALELTKAYQGRQPGARPRGRRPVR